MNSLQYNLSMVRGDTKNISIYNDVDMGFVNGDRVLMTVRDPDTFSSVFTKTITEFTTEGNALITILPADTKKLDPGLYCYDIRMVFASGSVITLVEKSDFNLQENVTNVS